MHQVTPAQTAISEQQLSELAKQLRVDAIRASAAAGSGHPTSSMSAADLMAVLFSRHLRYDFAAPENSANDHLVFSKGHASPLLYALYKAAGAIDDEELLTFREFGSRLQGHPTPEIPWVDVATGSLGQGLPISVGIALAAARLESSDLRVWVLCGDSELAEGSMWEAFEHAGYARLGNLVAIVDVNRLGQRGPTMHEWDTASLAARASACGWHVQEIDGHDLAAIDDAYARALEADAPAAIFARTKKGSGVVRGRGQAELARQAARRPGGCDRGAGRHPLAQRHGAARRRRPSLSRSPREPVERPRYEVGEKVATRGAYGDALAWIGSLDERVVALDAEVGNSTYAERFAQKHPDRFFEMFIAEQQMVAAAVGLQVRGWKPFASSFGAFLSRAYDFVRMAAISGADLKLCGSHVGVSIGPDGPSQMALEDIASLRAVLGSTVLYPCDANQTVQLVDAMREHRGISYLRTTRGATPVLYGPDETFPIGGSRTLRSSAERRRHPRRRRHHPARMPRRRRRPRRPRDRGPGDRPLLGQARRRRHPGGGGDRYAGAGHGGGPLGGGWDRRGRRHRAGGRRREHQPGAPRRHASDPAAAPRRRCWPPPGSTPRTSSPRRSGRWSPAPLRAITSVR